MIQSLDSNTIRRISSGQVITRVEDVVKELIENSIDAQATSIEVRLVGDGLTSIVVKDNGLGIPESDRSAMALRYHTSKLEDFGGLNKVETYGFRGEALNSICAISESTQITTKTSKDPVAINYSLDRTGKIVDSKPVGITEGTTVVVMMLFSHVPVRRQTVQKNSSKVGKAVQNLLTTYALAHPNIRFFLKLIYDNAAKLNFKSGEWILPSMKSQMQLLNELYGVEFTNNVEFVVWDTDKETSLEIENENYDILDGSNDAKSKIVIEAILPKPDAKPPVIFKNSQSFIYVNNRPVISTRGEIKNIVSMVKSTYTEIACKHGWTANKKTPFMWINIKLPTYDYDINVEPSKNVAFFHKGERILSAIENLLINVYGSCQTVSLEKEYSVGKVPNTDFADSSSTNLNLSPISSELLYLSSNEPSLADDIVVDSSSFYQQSPAQNDPELVLLDVDDLNEPLPKNQVVSDKRKGKVTDHGSTSSQMSDQVTKKANKEKRNDVKASRSLEEWYKTAQTSDVPTTLSIVSSSSTPPRTNNDRRGSKSMTNHPQNDSTILPYDSINIAYEESDNEREHVFPNNKSNESSNQRKQKKKYPLGHTDSMDSSSSRRNSINSNSHDDGPVRKRSALDDTENIIRNMEGQVDNENSDDTYHENEGYTRKRTRTDETEDIAHSQGTSIDSCNTLGDTRKASDPLHMNETLTETHMEFETGLEPISADIMNAYEPTPPESIDETNIPERITLESEAGVSVSEQSRREPAGSKTSPKKQSTLPKQGSGVRTIVIGQPTVDVLRSDDASNVSTNDDVNRCQETSKRKAAQDARKALELTDTLNHEMRLTFVKQSICRKKNSMESSVKFIDVLSSITCLNKMDCGLWTLSRKLNDNIVNLLIVHGERIRELVTLQTLVTSTELLPTRKLTTPIDMELELLGSDRIISYLKSLSYDQIPDENGAGVWWNMINQKCITANGVKIRWREDSVDYFSNMMQHLATNSNETKDVSLASTRSGQTMKILAGEAKQLVKQEDAKIVKRDDEMRSRIEESTIFLLRKMPNFGNGISYIDYNDHEPPLVMVERKSDDEIWYNDQMVVKLLWRYNAESDEITREI
ncbi:18269_t:CDS:10 [Cetraspora pellucida]|uniref:18269_t:CDS:1 n=1 Tax=Cetraspora pellucida TaxID=1433469 RepID=A0ACA9K8B0_9GLOM|nr:18269_t:CDS:10 [Cetraspora pellucida]